jgi:sugar lactone lactonase YvrE
VSTFAGNGVSGYADGQASSSEFKYPTSITFDNNGNLYVAETQGHRIRKITPDGTVSTAAGNGSMGWIDGVADSAEFNNPYGIICDQAGNIYVGDTYNGYIRQITTAGIVNTLSTNGLGFVNQPATPAQFINPLGLAIDSKGVLYVADGNVIKTISSVGKIDTLLGTGTQGYIDGIPSVSEFKAPAGLTFDKQGNLYIADTYNSIIRKYISNGAVSTFAGNSAGGFLDSTAFNAKFLQPQALAVDSVGNVYVGDYANARVRKIGIDGNVTTVAGNGVHAYVDSNSGIPEFYSPWGLAIDSKGNIYVADSRNNVIRKISFE